MKCGVCNDKKPGRAKRVVRPEGSDHDVPVCDTCVGKPVPARPVVSRRTGEPAVRTLPPPVPAGPPPADPPVARRVVLGRIPAPNEVNTYNNGK